MSQRAKRHPKLPQYLNEYELGTIDFTSVASAAPVVQTGRSVAPSARQQQRGSRSLPCQVIIVRYPKKPFTLKVKKSLKIFFFLENFHCFLPLRIKFDWIKKLGYTIALIKGFENDKLHLFLICPTLDPYERNKKDTLFFKGVGTIKIAYEISKEELIATIFLLNFRGLFKIIIITIHPHLLCERKIKLFKNYKTLALTTVDCHWK